MITSFLQSFLSSKTSLSTYNTGLLQAKAYRILKHRTNSILESYNLSSLDWALLGVLFDNPEGFKSLDLADLLGVEAPFVTVMIDRLEKKMLVKRMVSKKDKRIKIITLTNKAKRLVPKLEKTLQKEIKSLLSGSSIPQIKSYLEVLRCVVRNS